MLILNGARYYRWTCALFLGLVLISLNVEGQSGRRIPKKERPSPAPSIPPAADSPAPTSTPRAGTSESSASSRDEKKPPQFTFLLVRYTSDVAIPITYADVVVSGCLRQLQRSSALEARPGPEMNRKEASDRAKRGTDTHVLLLQVEVDDTGFGSSGGTRRTSLDYIDIYVDYFIFAPITGKLTASGRVYKERYRPSLGGPGGTGPVSVPTVRSPLEHQLHQVGIDIGERVLNKFGLTPPPVQY